MGQAVSLTKIGSGTQTPGGVNTFSGVVSANGGRLAFATSANLGDGSGSNTITLDGGALAYTGAGGVDLTVNRVVEIAAAGGTLEASGSTGALAVSGGISFGSTGNLTKAGPGTVILPAGTGWNGGANSVTVSDGTLRAGFGTAGIGKLTVGATGNMDFRDSATETLTLGTGAGAITLTGGARLGFELDSSANDRLIVPAGGTVTLNFFNFGGGVAATTYNLLSAPSGLSGATYALGTAPLGFNYTINVTDMLVSLTTVAYTPRYWTGALGTSWSTIAGPASNWSTDAVGTIDAGAIPGAAHTVIFSASAPAQPAALVTTLDGAVAVDSLQFIAQPGNVTSVTVNPGAGGTLSLTPASTSGGIYVGPGGGVATLAAPLTLGAAQTWNVDGTGANGSALVISGNTAFGGAVNKTGPGAVTLSGNNTGSAAFTLSAGRLNIDTNTALPTGTFTIGAGTTIDSGTGATLTANNVQNWGGSFTCAGTGQILAFGGSAGNSVVNVSNNITDYYTFTGANNAGAVSVYNQTAGTVNFTTTATGNATNVLATNGYGYMNITGGSLVAKGRFGPSNGATGTGVIYLGTGGTLDHTGGEWFLMSYAPSGNGGLSQVTVASGGSLLHAGASSNFGLNMDRTNGYAVLNIAGGLVTTSTRTITFGNAGGASTNTTGMINLAAGTLTFGVAMTNGNTTGSGNNAFLNFAGGTLQPNAAVTNVIPATAANQTFTSTIFGAINNSAVAGAPSFLGGLTVDTNGFATSFSNAFLAAAGSGVSQADIVIPGGGNSGYIGAPAVQFSNAGVVAGGTPASGYAVISGGQVTGIVITNPGTYTAGSTPTVTLTGGGGSITAFSTAALNNANTAGGLAKIGGGTLTLSGASTYAGATTITAGTLQLGAAGATGSLSPSSAITNDGVFVINRTNAAVQGADFSGSPITGTGSFVQAGTGSTQFTAANSYNGTTTVSAGTLIVGDGAVAGTIGTGAVTLTAGTLAFNRTDTYTLQATNLVTGAGAVTLNSGTVAAAVDGQFNTTGALILGSPNGSAVTAGLGLTNGNSTFGSLTVQTNSASSNTITIGAGKTLTINGSVSVGNTVSTGQFGQTFLDFLGTGSLVVNAPAGTFKVGNNIGTTNNSADATVVLSALSNVAINLGSGILSVQPNGDNAGGNALSTLTLSNTANTITAAAINVGPSATGAAHVLNLGGGTNILNTDALNLGTGARDAGVLKFLSTGASVTLRNSAGTGRTNVTMGTTVTQATAYTTASVFDTTGNSADLAIATLAMDLGAKTANNTTNLTFNTGTLDIRTINMAVAKGTGTSVHAITIGGGTVKLGGSAAFGDTGTGAVTLATAATGELAITGGTVTSSVDITKAAGTGTAILTLDGGTLDMSGFNIGGAVAISTLNFRSGTLQNVGQINNGASVLTKTTAGTATITGANSYTGGTSVNDGILILNGLNTGTGVIRGTVDVNPGATLRLASANALGYNTGVRVTTVNISGGTMESVVNGDQGFNQTYNLTGGTMQSNGGVSNQAASQWFAFGSGFGGTTAVNSLASGATSVIAGRVIFRNDNLNTNIDFTVADGAASTDLLVSAAITQNAGLAVGLTKAGAGLMQLTGLNSYAGVTTISNGILSIASSANLGSAAATNSIAINGGTLQDTGAGVNLGTNRSVAIGGSGATISVTTGSDLNISGAISGAGNTLTKTGAGVLKITGAQTYGTLTTSAGTTDVYTAVGTGTSTVNANATTNFSTSQTLAALNIGAGAVVTFGALPPPFAGDGGKFAAGVVPEPGSIGLLMVGALGILSRRRRGAGSGR